VFFSLRNIVSLIWNQVSQATSKEAETSKKMSKIIFSGIQNEIGT